MIIYNIRRHNEALPPNASRRPLIDTRGARRGNTVRGHSRAECARIDLIALPLRKVAQAGRIQAGKKTTDGVLPSEFFVGARSCNAPYLPVIEPSPKIDRAARMRTSRHKNIRRRFAVGIFSVRSNCNAPCLPIIEPSKKEIAQWLDKKTDRAAVRKTSRKKEDDNFAVLFFRFSFEREIFRSDKSSLFRTTFGVRHFSSL